MPITKVSHSESKDAWNVIGTKFGGKYKIARVPYFTEEGLEQLNTMNKAEALHHAKLISDMFNGRGSL